jgi:hypothetical protein
MQNNGETTRFCLPLGFEDRSEGKADRRHLSSVAIVIAETHKSNGPLFGRRPAPTPDRPRSC